LSNAPVLATERLNLRRFDLQDAPFVIELVNEPGWLRFIGDKGVRTVEDAHRYLRDGPLSMYSRFGFGLYLVERKSDGAPIGTCGLIKRDTLEHVDIGFAFLARVAKQGYAHEAARAVVAQAKSLRLARLLAITTPTNHASQKLLVKIGLRFDKEITMSGDAEMLHLFVAELESV
jgi:ribosomal-protein-alanine N-acetyltransferase